MCVQPSLLLLLPIQSYPILCVYMHSSFVKLTEIVKLDRDQIGLRDVNVVVFGSVEVVGVVGIVVVDAILDVPGSC